MSTPQNASKANPTFDAGTFDLLPAVRIGAEREELIRKEADWLRARGWKTTCETPGSYWMWTIHWGGNLIMLDQGAAARFQDHWDRRTYFIQHPGEMGE